MQIVLYVVQHVVDYWVNNPFLVFDVSSDKFISEWIADICKMMSFHHAFGNFIQLSQKPKWFIKVFLLRLSGRGTLPRAIVSC